jgi:hypothetical protein
MLWSDQARLSIRPATPIDVLAAAAVLNAANTSDSLALAYLVDRSAEVRAKK